MCVCVPLCVLMCSCATLSVGMFVCMPFCLLVCATLYVGVMCASVSLCVMECACVSHSVCRCARVRATLCDGVCVCEPHCL